MLILTLLTLLLYPNPDHNSNLHPTPGTGDDDLECGVCMEREACLRLYPCTHSICGELCMIKWSCVCVCPCTRTTYDELRVLVCSYVPLVRTPHHTRAQTHTYAHTHMHKHTHTHTQTHTYTLTRARAPSAQAPARIASAPCTNTHTHTDSRVRARPFCAGPCAHRICTMLIQRPPYCPFCRGMLGDIAVIGDLGAAQKQLQARPAGRS